MNTVASDQAVDAQPRSQQYFLDKALELSPVFNAEAPKSEELGAMTPAVLEAYIEGGFIGMVTPRELGGDELGGREWLQVLEEMGRIDGPTGWCMMVMSAHAGLFGASLGDAAVQELFKEMPRISGMPAPRGKAERVDGGYMFNGKHQFASAGSMATHFTAGAVVYENGEPVIAENGQPEMIAVVVPRAEVTNIGNWDVNGMQATASYDYDIENVFISDEYALVWNPWPREFSRGGAYLRQSLDPNGPAMHTPLALGMAQRALEEVATIAQTRKRVDATYATVAEQPMFQHDLTLLDAKLRAARLWFYDVVRRSEEQLTDHGGPLPNHLTQRLKQAARHCHDVAIECVDFAYEWSGSAGLRKGGVVGRLFQNMHAINQHIVVDRNIAVVAAPVIMEDLVAGRDTLGLD